MNVAMTIAAALGVAVAVGGRAMAAAPPSASQAPGAGPAALDRAARPGRVAPAIPVWRGGEEDAGPRRAGATALVVTAGLLVMMGAGLWALRRSMRDRRVGRPGLRWDRWFSPSSKEHVAVVQSRQLTARTSVHVLRWGGREWLLGCNDAEIRLIGERPVTADEREAAVVETGPGDGAPRARSCP